MFKLNPFTGLLDEVGSSVAGPGTGDMIAANNLSDLSNPATALTNLGGTTVGQNFFTLANPSAITFPRVNADNSVSALDAATFRASIGAGTSSFNGVLTSLIGVNIVGGVIQDDFFVVDGTGQWTNKTPGNVKAILNLAGTLTGGGTIATGGFTLTVPATGTVVLEGGVLALGGFSSITGTLANANLANSAITINGAAISLGGSVSDLQTTNGVLAFGGFSGITGAIAPANVTGTAAILGANTFTGVQTLPNGTAGAPSLNLGDSTTGLYRSAANEIGMAISGALGAKLGASGLLTLADAGGFTFVSGGTNYRIGYVAARGITIFESGSATVQVSNGWTVASGSRYGFSSGGADGATVDTASMREAAQHWTHRNGTTAQILSVSNTWTSTTNFERFKIDWAATANTCRIGTSKGSGGGSARGLHFEVGDTAAIKIGTTGLLDFAASVANADVAAVSTHSVPISVAGTIYNFLVRT